MSRPFHKPHNPMRNARSDGGYYVSRHMNKSQSHPSGSFGDILGGLFVFAVLALVVVGILAAIF